MSNLKKRPKKKKGFFGKIVGVFKGDGIQKNDKNAPAPSKSTDGEHAAAVRGMIKALEHRKI